MPDSAAARLVDRKDMQLILPGTARGRHDHEIPHHDRARRSPARQIRLPRNPFGLAPARANRLIRRRATATWPEKLWPVGGRGHNAPEHHDQHHQQSSLRHDRNLKWVRKLVDAAGIGGSSRSFWIFRPSGECAAVGRVRRKSHCDETSAVPAVWAIRLLVTSCYRSGCVASGEPIESQIRN